MDRSLWQLTDGELRDATEDSFRRLQQAEATYLEHLRELDSRPDAVPGARPGQVAKTFARHRLRRTQAAADVRAAHALADELPMLGKALAAGAVSRDHVDVAVRALRQIPRHLLDGDGLAKVDAWVTETAESLAPLETDKAAKHLLHRLDPDGFRTFDPDALDRRELSAVVDATGMVIVRGQLDPANGAAFLAALDALSAPAPIDPDSQLPVPDERSKRQRQADAAGSMARITLTQLGQGRAETDRPKVVVHLPAGEEQHLGALTPAWLARFACDSLVEAVDTDKLLLGRAQRTATAAQRRFLAARDGGCVIPGCHAPPGWTDAHHIDWWSTGGPTDVTNLALVCGRHHTDIHTGVWALQMIDGLPWATPPRWIDPHQRPVRNTYRQHRQAAGQLALDLSPPGVRDTDHTRSARRAAARAAPSVSTGR